MTIVKNEVFIGLLHEKFYLVGSELTFDGGRKCSQCRLNVACGVNFMVFMYTVSICTISVVALIGIGTINIIKIVIRILRPTFLRQGF